MVSLNFTTVVFLFSFIAFLALMKLFFFDPISRVIVKRESVVEENLSESRLLLDKVRKEITEKDPSSILKEAQTKSQSIINEVLNSANLEKEKLLSSLQARLELDIEANLNKLKSEETKFRTELPQISAELVELLVSKLTTEFGKKKEAIRS